jgi:HPt (histidine-containing phosphotransfer) domain-containing protein
MSGVDIPIEMKAKYLERRKQDYTDCLNAFLKSDFETFLRVGHQLKGNAASFGFDDLGVIATEMEQAAKNKDMSQIKISLDKFDQFLQSK